jgi:hypothetical protein
MLLLVKSDLQLSSSLCLQADALAAAAGSQHRALRGLLESLLGGNKNGG